MEIRSYVNRSGKIIEPRTADELVDIAYRQSGFGDVSNLLGIIFGELDSEMEFGTLADKDEIIQAILDRQRELGMTPPLEVQRQ